MPEEPLRPGLKRHWMSANILWIQLFWGEGSGVFEGLFCVLLGERITTVLRRLCGLYG
jgi:hypothetical protein